VWGDGKQTRSYCYIDDCVEGIYRLMRSDFREPLNLGQDRMITIDELVDIVAKVAGKQIEKQYDLSKPQGVRGRNSDNSLLRKVLDWEPVISLEEGLARTYEWIQGELVRTGRILFLRTCWSAPRTSHAAARRRRCFTSFKAAPGGTRCGRWGLPRMPPGGSRRATWRGRTS